MSYTVHIEPFPGKPLAIVRRRAAIPDLAKVIPEACGTVWNALRSQQIKGAGRHVAVYLDDQVNLEIGVELDAPLPATARDVFASALPVGDVATTTHLGPYPLLAAAHQAIHAWCRANRREPIRPCWEIYAHWQDAWNRDPSQIRTDVYYLLKA